MTNVVSIGGTPFAPVEVPDDTLALAAQLRKIADAVESNASLSKFILILASQNHYVQPIASGIPILEMVGALEWAKGVALDTLYDDDDEEENDAPRP